jgi:hypothetical protein
MAATWSIGQLSQQAEAFPSLSAIATLSRTLLGQYDRMDKRMHRCGLLYQTSLQPILQPVSESS